uniref:Jun dimerization protein 2 n=1 Tax=Scleropages formosus TaxID=113540 RepID=A0A8C9SKN6_SCLFO
MTRGGPERVPHSQTLPDSDRYLNGLMQRFPLFKIYSRSSAEQKREYRSDLAAKSAAGSAMMPGQIPDPSLTTGSLPSLGPLAGISATTLTDQLKFADLRNLGAMLSPLHFLGRLGKRPAPLKTEVRPGSAPRGAVGWTHSRPCWVLYRLHRSRAFIFNITSVPLCRASRTISFMGMAKDGSGSVLPSILTPLFRIFKSVLLTVERAKIQYNFSIVYMLLPFWCRNVALDKSRLDGFPRQSCNSLTDVLSSLGYVQLGCFSPSF